MSDPIIPNARFCLAVGINNYDMMKDPKYFKSVKTNCKDAIAVKKYMEDMGFLTSLMTDFNYKIDNDVALKDAIRDKIRSFSNYAECNGN